MKCFGRLLSLAMAAALAAGCVLPAVAAGAGGAAREIEIAGEAVPLAASPSGLVLPEASGKLTKTSSRAVIDYSNTQDGYVMVKFTGTTTKRLKVQVAGPSASTPKKLVYSYDLKAGEWTTFPLSDGNGNYKVTVAENTNATKYAVVASVSFTVTLKDEFAPYLRPNQYVDYAAAAKTVEKARELAGKETDVLKQVEAVYNYVVKNFTYDQQRAATVQSGYLPVLDSVLAEKRASASTTPG